VILFHGLQQEFAGFKERKGTPFAAQTAAEKKQL
jgi:ribosomal protein S11